MLSIKPRTLENGVQNFPGFWGKERSPGCLMSGFLPENPGVIEMDIIAEIRRLHFVENENETVNAGQR